MPGVVNSLDDFRKSASQLNLADHVRSSGKQVDGNHTILSAFVQLRYL